MALTHRTVRATTVEAVSEFGLGGTTPATQAAHIADPTGGGTVDAQSRTAIAAILDVLDRFGLTAAS